VFVIIALASRYDTLISAWCTELVHILYVEDGGC
jgi:hypothetical protein